MDGLASEGDTHHGLWDEDEADRDAGDQVTDQPPNVVVQDPLCGIQADQHDTDQRTSRPEGKLT